MYGRRAIATSRFPWLLSSTITSTVASLIIGIASFSFFLLDDVVDVVEEETEEDMMLMHGIEESDIHSSPATSATSRFPWLLSSTITSTVASLIIGIASFSFFLLDDVVDVVEEETEEDMMLMHGIEESDIHSSPATSARSRFPWFRKPEKRSACACWSPATSARSRFPWLLSSTITSTVASLIIGMFGGVIEKEVALATLMPIIANLSGSSGNQTVTVIVR